MEHSANVKIKNFLHRIGDGVVSGIGLLIVGSLGAFLWTAFSSAQKDLVDAQQELAQAQLALEKQLEINSGMKTQLDRLIVALESLRKSVEANRDTLLRMASKGDPQSNGSDLTTQEGSHFQDLTADPYDTLQGLLDSQESLLRQ